MRLAADLRRSGQVARTSATSGQISVVYRPALGALPPGHSRGPKLHRAGFTERKAFLQCFGFGWTELQGHCYPVSAPIPQHISQYLAQHQWNRFGFTGCGAGWKTCGGLATRLGRAP